MCGITAVWLKNGNAVPITKKLLIGLKNHGTSSCGMAWQDAEGIKMKKVMGSPENLNGEVEANVIIGHTRMPSVGNVNIKNAHPFMACDDSFALVHNGTFTNDEFLERLLEREHDIKGTTDSEIMTHFIEEKKDRIGLEASLALFEGQRLLVVTKNKIIGYGELTVIQDKNGIYVTNDLDAMGEIFEGKEKAVYHLKENSILVIQNGKMTIKGKKIEPKRQVIQKAKVWKFGKSFWHLGKSWEDEDDSGCGEVNTTDYHNMREAMLARAKRNLLAKTTKKNKKEKKENKLVPKIYYAGGKATDVTKRTKTEEVAPSIGSSAMDIKVAKRNDEDLTPKQSTGDRSIVSKLLRRKKHGQTWAWRRGQ